MVNPLIPKFPIEFVWIRILLNIPVTKEFTVNLEIVQPFQCWGYFRSQHKDANIFEKYLNPVMFVFIGKLSLSTFIWVPIC